MTTVKGTSDEKLMKEKLNEIAVFYEQLIASLPKDVTGNDILMLHTYPVFSLVSQVGSFTDMEGSEFFTSKFNGYKLVMTKD